MSWKTLVDSLVQTPTDSGVALEAEMRERLNNIERLNPAIYWYPGSGQDFTALLLDAPNNTTGRRLFPLNEGTTARPLLLWMNDYASQFNALGSEGRRFEIKAGKPLPGGRWSIHADAEILPGARRFCLNFHDLEHPPLPLTIFQIKITGGTGKHQRPTNGDIYTVFFSCAESEQIFRQVFLRHSLRVEVIALVGQGSWGAAPARPDFYSYTAIPRLCAEHREAIGQVNAYLLDTPEFAPQGYRATDVQVQGWRGDNVAMWVPIMQEDSTAP